MVPSSHLRGEKTWQTGALQRVNSEHRSGRSAGYKGGKRNRYDGGTHTRFLPEHASRSNAHEVVCGRKSNRYPAARIARETVDF